METGNPKETISNQRLYSELEKIILDIRTHVHGNEKIEHNKRVYSLLSPKNITKNYKIESDEGDAAIARFDDKNSYPEEYRKNGRKDRIIINKSQLYDSSDFIKELYLSVSHELSHVLVGEHKMHRNCNLNGNALDHCFHFFDYLSLFGKEALPKAYCYVIVGPYGYEEETYSLIGYTYSSYQEFNRLPLTKLNKEDVIRLVDNDSNFRSFLINNIIMINLDKLDETEKQFVAKIASYGKIKAAFYRDGHRIKRNKLSIY
jgi:hypothetical protein